MSEYCPSCGARWSQWDQDSGRARWSCGSSTSNGVDFIETRLCETRQKRIAAEKEVASLCKTCGLLGDRAREAICRLQDALAQRDILIDGIREVAQFAQAHHSQQPLHVILHGLTVDVPAQLESLIEKTCG